MRLGCSPSRSLVVPKTRHFLVRNVIVGLLLRPSRCLSMQSYFARSKVIVPLRPRTRCLQEWKVGKQSSKLNSINIEDVRMAYHQGETDGILEYAASLDASTIRVEDIVSVTLDVSEGRSSEAASMMNAWIGACSLVKGPNVATDLVLGLMTAFGELKEKRNITPDIVTYSLAYSALHGEPSAQSSAAYFIHEAARQSKKIAGGKRRRAVAAARGKGPVLNVKDVEDDLRRLCGEDFSVLHETDDLFVVNKPSGVPCFHRKTTTAGKIRKGKAPTMASDISLEDALTACNAPLSTLNPEARGLVHRLDRGTSGCLVLAKNDETHALLVSEFFLRRTSKLYTTVVSPAPHPSVPDEGSIDHPVDGHPARSRFRILERVSPSAAIMEFEIFTGRKHQIRVHSSAVLGSPVYRDPLYTEEKIDNDDKEKFLLHSWKLKIPQFDIDVEAPQPRWWGDVVAELKETPMRQNKSKPR